MHVSRRHLLRIGGCALTVVAAAGTALGSSIDPIYRSVRLIVLEGDLTAETSVSKLVLLESVMRDAASFVSAKLAAHRRDITVISFPSKSSAWPQGIMERNVLRVLVRFTVREASLKDLKVNLYIGSIGLQLSKDQEVRGIGWNPSEPFLSSKDTKLLNEQILKVLKSALDEAIVVPFLSFPPDI